MKKENAVIIFGIIIVIALLIGGSYAIKNASGVDPPFTVIESQSMQHSNESQIGIIDTADMILVKSPEKTDIVTYVEGYSSDYKTFGDYGSVIVYKRTIGNPVIHRAIIYLEYNTNTAYWEAPSLNNFNHEIWSCSNGLDDSSRLSGSLKIMFNDNYRKVDFIQIDLINLHKKSGYITMGDNNGDTDQNSKIFENEPVEKTIIKSIAWKEIPWIGAFKLISKGELSKVESLVPNTIPNIFIFIFTIILIIISIGFTIDEIMITKNKRR